MSQHRVQPVSDAKRKSTRIGRVLAVLAAILVAVVVVAAIAAWALLLRADRRTAPGQPVTVDIARGSSAADIAAELSKQGVVPNALMFRLRAHYSDRGNNLKPGVYSLSTGMPYDLVLEKLAAGPDVVYYDVTIPEGFTLPRIASRVASITGVPEAEFLHLAQTGAPKFAAKHPYLKNAYGGSLEGFLFPKTYRVKKGTSAEAIIEMMLDQFDQEVAGVDLSHAKSKNLTLTDVVTVASILERETRLAREYPLVSSVIYNRLALPMRLQLDSTVFYGLPEGTKVLTKADLARVTPYNTYRRDGLPATPICNPGILALKAAARPSKTKYLYYVLTSKDGSQTFTTNYKDFLKAVQKYRSLFGY